MHFPAPLLAAATLFGLLGRTLACVQYGVSIEEIGYYANGNIVDNGDEVCHGDETGWDFDCHDGFSARINDITADDVTYNTPWGSFGFGADCTYYCIDDGGVDECTIVCLASNYGC